MELSTEVNLKEELLQILEECLRSGETNKALVAIKTPKYSTCIETCSWDIVPKIVENLSNVDKKVSLGAQEVLMALVERANPEEMLLELIEKAEGAKKDACFLALLPPMQLTLSRMPEKRGRSLQWCLNTISQHLTANHSDGSDESESEEENVKENNVDKHTQRAVIIYQAALEFCSPFIDEVSLVSSTKTFDKPVMVQRDRQRRVLVTFLLQALSQTAANVDLQINKDVKNPCRLLSENIVHALCSLCSDVLLFLTFMEERSKKAQKLNMKDIDQTWEDVNPFLYEDVIPITGIGVLYYLVLVEGVRYEFVPCVYSTLFIFQNILHVINGMISSSGNMTVFKGLQIAEVIFQRLGRPPLSADILEDPVLGKFCVLAVETMFRSMSVPTARLAVNVFKTYVKSFSLKGQYQILKNLFRAIKEPGPKGFIVSQLKDAVDRSLKELSNEEGIELFRGASLFRLIASLCSLPDGLETDVAEHADHIISTLNFVWYMLLCKDSKKLGILNHVEWFEESLLETLGEAMAKCRAKYEQDRMTLIKHKENLDESTSQIFKEGSMLGQEEKLQAVETTINKLVLIESLLTDVDRAMNSWRDYD